MSVPRFRSVTGAAAFEQGSLHMQPRALLLVMMKSGKYVLPHCSYFDFEKKKKCIPDLHIVGFR